MATVQITIGDDAGEITGGAIIDESLAAIVAAGKPWAIGQGDQRTQKIVDGQLVDKTADEIAAFDASRTT